MKRILCIAILMLALVFSFAACGDSPTIEISDDGYWVIDGEKTDVLAKGEKGDSGIPGIQGEKGTDGTTPSIEINEDGYWVINGVVTDVKAQGEDGSDASSTLPKYKVFFNTNSESVITAQEVEFGNKATEPAAPTKNGYTFDGWYVEDEKWSFIGYSITEDITLTAKWIPINYTISYFNLASNEYPKFNETQTQTYTIEDDVELYVPTQNGAYSFCGWYLDETLTQPKAEIAKGSFGDINLYAKWENTGIEIENESNLSAVYNCRFNTEYNKFKYTFLFEITELNYDYIECEFELQKPDGTAYTNEELLNTGITYGTQHNAFYIELPNDVKGTLVIKSVTVKTSTPDSPIDGPLIDWNP